MNREKLEKWERNAETLGRILGKISRKAIVGALIAFGIYQLSHNLPASIAFGIL